MPDALERSRRIVFTGAAGGIGTMVRPLLAAAYPGLVLSDRVKPGNLRPDETFVSADLTRPDEVAKAVEGAHSVLHFGGHSTEGPWDAVLQANIVGCYNLFEAARQAGVKRIVFASSNHAVGFYPRRKKIGTDVTVRPDSRYGVSKAFGEALGALYSDKHGIAVTCLRIGNVGPRPLDVRRLSIWISPEDLVQLIRIGLDHPQVRFEILYGASDNAATWWDNSRAHKLGYRPTGKAEAFRAHAEAEQAKIGPDPVGDLFQGGTFCSAEFTNDVKRAGP
ncbi:NAD(P)-dependent oxidoreductase [Enhydrobacter sp.]|jgi:uronate dehydrogenase|uniref:NAD-dependent epimerase/dehydratase family protein n=1 Tax=Enhydrobacter sp. TaxID=1894999 RepID=UPI0026100580|nr:NAD(P)-dependent oxidoreductase [Enhydrobacter sp.]WIM11552.1 MAG: UDP-glucose 4-epimerase [Enhydrobacter sp.]